ncbi:MAG: hypothetical protein GXP26_14175 [Planctomycetes bacterium]|nr:hypothetical protein [Planctomycetota bacterium]
MSLPLPLVPFEDYMLFDDRPTHPMSFFLRLRLSGSCDAAALDIALRRALERHPLLSATAQKAGRFRFCWQPLDPNQAAVRWQTDSSEAAPTEDGGGLATYLDLSQRSGLEVIGTRSAGGVELLFQFHHSCSDGLGGLQLIEDVLLFYAHEVATPSAPLHVEKPEECRLKVRAKFGLSRWDLLRIAPKQALGLLGAREFMMRTPDSITPVEPENLSSPLPQTYPTAVRHEFSRAETKRILLAARARETTVNNLLASCLFVALHQFRKQLGIAHHRRWIRLSIPINLRRPGAECSSAANCVSMIFLDRRPQAIEDEKGLLASIHTQMARNLKMDLGLTFPLMLRLIKPLGILATLKGDEQCRCTAVLSNLQRPLIDCPLPRRDGKIIAGDLQLDGLDCLPPVRPKTNAAFGVLTYADRLNITQHYDQRVISADEAERLLDLYVEGILASCG